MLLKYDLLRFLKYVRQPSRWRWRDAQRVQRLSAARVVGRCSCLVMAYEETRHARMQPCCSSGCKPHHATVVGLMKHLSLDFYGGRRLGRAWQGRHGTRDSFVRVGKHFGATLHDLDGVWMAWYSRLCKAPSDGAVDHELRVNHHTVCTIPSTNQVVARGNAEHLHLTWPPPTSSLAGATCY